MIQGARFYFPFGIRRKVTVRVDIAIIGAGAVGCAAALHLKQQFPERSVAVLESGAAAFGGASRYNSGVIHSGVHEKSDLLKARLARRGSALLVDFCRREDVPLRRTGMLIAVAWRDLLKLPRELATLALLIRNSRRQGIPLAWWNPGRIKKEEPHLRAAFGIYLPMVWMVDQRTLGDRLVACARKAGADFFFNRTVTVAERWGLFYRLEALTPAGLEAYEARAVVNAAGVRADLVAALGGFSGYRIYPWRGEYYEVVGEKRNLIRALPVYPALPPGHPVKGVHLTKTVDGRLLIGPNAAPWGKREDDFFARSAPRQFLAAAKRFLPELEVEDLRWAYSGLRAKTTPGAAGGDFIVKCDALRPTWVNCIGIESPGLTASLAIAEEVTTLIRGRFIV